MIRLGIQISILFIFYMIGTMLQTFLHLPIPGSVIGMLLLFVFLMTGLIKPLYISKGAQFMIRHLVLFFIPATVGIISYYTVFKGRGLWLVVITIVSTFLVLLISGWVSQILLKRGTAYE